MKRSITTSLLALVALAMAASAPSAQGQCSNLTTKGTYGATASGSLGGLPLAFVGIVTNDGVGNFTASYTLTVNGTTTTGLHAEGTYHVKADCTGSVTDNTNNAHYELVVLRHGAEMFGINTDPGNTFVLDFKKQ